MKGVKERRRFSLLYRILVVIGVFLLFGFVFSFVYLMDEDKEVVQDRKVWDFASSHSSVQEWFQLLETFKHITNGIPSSVTLEYYQSMMKECATGAIKASGATHEAPYLRMTGSRKCTLAWWINMNFLSLRSLQDLEDIKLMGKRGAFKVIFESEAYIKGYYKPCLPLPEYPDGVDESWTSEIISFHISALLMFNRTNPGLGRKFSREQIVGYKLMPLSHFEKINELCPNRRRDARYLYGSLISWNPFALLQPPVEQLIPLFPTSDRDIKKMKISELKQNEKERRTWLLEQSLYQIFQYLIDYQKQGHNTFQMSNGLPASDKFGPLVYLDNDRARWDTYQSFANTTTCKSCTFPRNIIEQIRIFGPKSNEKLGELLAASLSYDPLHKEINFTVNNQKIIDLRVASILDCVEECLKFYPHTKVLFDFDYHTGSSLNIL